MSDGKFCVMCPDGYRPMGYVSAGGISITTGWEAAGQRFGWREPDIFRDEIGEVSFTIDHVDEDALGSFFDVPEIGCPQQLCSLVLEYRPKTRSELLRERAEAVGGRFLRSYLRSQRRSRGERQTPSRRRARRRRFVVRNARIVPTTFDGSSVRLLVEGMV